MDFSVIHGDPARTWIMDEVAATAVSERPVKLTLQSNLGPTFHSIGYQPIRRNVPVRKHRTDMLGIVFPNRAHLDPAALCHIPPTLKKLDLGETTLVID